MHLALSFGVTLLEFQQNLLSQIENLSRGVIGMMILFIRMCLAVLIQHRHLTERQRRTDRRTQDHTISYASIALRGSKNKRGAIQLPSLIDG